MPTGAKVPRMVSRKVEKQGFMMGVVVAKRQPKTLRVAVDRRVHDQKYGNWKTRRTLFMVHDELEECVYGDIVVIKQSRRHSKMKAFEVHDIAVKYQPAQFLQENPEYAEAMAAISKAKAQPGSGE